MVKKYCSLCGETLICGANQTMESCWCFAYPMIMSVNSQQDCLCESCLSHSIQEKIVSFPASSI
ncbi:MAG: cysteine-rich CWC family protein, partial [Methylococcales bacterium]|nr:cysteine-rich CWC family protein [Methylococcales bacterium]